MNEYHAHIADLIARDLQGLLHADEQEALHDALAAEPALAGFYDSIRKGEQIHDGLHGISTVNVDAAVQRLVEEVTVADNRRPVHRVHFLKTAWVRYAAAVILLFAVGAYLWNNFRDQPGATITQTEPVPAEKDIAPGSDRAILTLSDGRKVELTTDQQSITDAGLTIENRNGKLLYGKGGEVAYNTMTTPKGGQYQVTLPDGTHVWLNAASSITYPTSFVSGTRNVKITGEAYFEVANNAKQPFVVDVDGKAQVEVLGTSFNINSYADEAGIHATLLEGKIKVSKDKNASILTPGQQAVIQHTIQVHPVNSLRYIAWKNGFFDFEDKKLSEVMRELARWYDIEVSYAPGVKDMEFVGTVRRNLNLSQAMDVLEQMGVHLTLTNNRKLLVQP